MLLICSESSMKSIKLAYVGESSNADDLPATPVDDVHAGGQQGTDIDLRSGHELVLPGKQKNFERLNKNKNKRTLRIKS